MLLRQYARQLAYPPHEVTRAGTTVPQLHGVPRPKGHNNHTTPPCGVGLPEAPVVIIRHVVHLDEQAVDLCVDGSHPLIHARFVLPQQEPHHLNVHKEATNSRSNYAPTSFRGNLQHNRRAAPIYRSLTALAAQVHDLANSRKCILVWNQPATPWCVSSCLVLSLTSPVRTQKQFFVLVYDVMEWAVSSIPLCLFVPTSDFLS